MVSSTETVTAATAQNPPWLFGILSIPYGAFNGVIVVLIPFLLRKHGVTPDRIAGVIAISSIPNIWYFLYSPIVDARLLRRTWVMIAAGVSGLCALGAIADPSLSLTALTILLLGGNIVSMLLGAACGAVMTTLNAASRGRASGWYQAGNLGGGALGAGALVWAAGTAPLPVLAAAASLIVFLPALAALAIVETRPHRLPIIPLFKAVGRDVWDVLRSRATLIGLVFFLSPVGSAAVVNLISSIGPDYHASDAQVAWVSGLAGGLLSALGCLIGGWICDRMSRRAAYALAGLLSVPFSAWLAFGPATPFTYAGGYAGYALAAGIAYAAFTALELDVLGRRPHAAGTAYSLLAGSSNLPIAYMTWLDGVGYKYSGTRGLMAVDLLANGIGGVLLLLFAVYCNRRRKGF
jgi:MFS transporter, PAT family, beta-lactamase induction signal transducer AmpG